MKDMEQIMVIPYFSLYSKFFSRKSRFSFLILRKLCYLTFQPTSRAFRNVMHTAVFSLLTSLCFSSETF